MVTLGLPALATLAGLAIAWFGRSSCRPKVATIATTVALASAAIGTVAAVTLYAIAFTTSDRVSRFCSVLLGHSVHRHPAGAAVALGALAFITWRCSGVVRRHLAVIRPYRQCGPLVIVDEPEARAFAVPGRRGTVVVSSGLVKSLSPDERLVVVSHERAHLDCKHHRYTLIADLAVAVIPFVRPFAASVRHSTERWADDIAAATVGSRELVGLTIAKAALASGPVGTFAFGGDHVVNRVEALLAPQIRPARAAAVSSVAGCALAFGGAVTQLHHFASELAHLM